MGWVGRSVIVRWAKEGERSNFSAITKLHHFSAHDATVCRSWWPSNHLSPSMREGEKVENWSNDIFFFQFWTQLEEIVKSGTVFELVLSSVAWVANQYLVSPSRKTDTCLALLIKCQFSHWIVAIILIICTILWPLFRFALSNTCDGAFRIHQIVQNRWMTQPVKISSLRSWGIACTRFLDAIASPSSYPCRSVSQSVGR